MDDEAGLKKLATLQVTTTNLEPDQLPEHLSALQQSNDSLEAALNNKVRTLPVSTAFEELRAKGLSEIGWALPDSTDIEGWVRYGYLLLRMSAQTNWARGDWWNYAHTRKLLCLKEFVNRPDWKAGGGEAYSTIANAGHVCRRFHLPASGILPVRRPALSFQAHKALVSLAVADPERTTWWQDKAETEHMGPTELTNAVQQEKSGKKQPRRSRAKTVPAVVEEPVEEKPVAEKVEDFLNAMKVGLADRLATLLGIPDADPDAVRREGRRQLSAEERQRVARVLEHHGQEAMAMAPDFWDATDERRKRQAEKSM